MAKTAKSRKPMSARSKGLIALVLLVALTVFVSCLSIGGMKLDAEGVNILLPWVPVSSEQWPDSLPLSRALGGGSYVEYTASVTGEVALADELQNAVKVMEDRLTAKGVDGRVTVKGEDTLRIEVQKMDEEMLSSVLQLATAPGKFEFTMDGEAAFMTGEQIKEAGVSTTDGLTFSLALQTTEEGRQLLADASAAHIGGEMSIYRDGVLLISAGLNQAFTDGQVAVPLGLEWSETVDVALQINSGAFALNLVRADAGEFVGSGAAALNVILIAVAALLVVALVYAVINGKLTGIAAMWTVWCAVMLEMFFYATLVLATLNVAYIIALLLGVLLMVYTAVTRTDAISKQIADGSAPKTATKLGLRATAKTVWMVHGIALAVSLILMIFDFTQVFGYTLCAGVAASALVVPLMRLFQACFTAITAKPAMFGKAK